MGEIPFCSCTWCSPYGASELTSAADKKWRWQLLCALASTVAWRFWPKPSWNKGTDIRSLLRKLRDSREVVSCQRWAPCLAKSRRGSDELICWWASALRFSFFLPDFGEEAPKSHMAFAASIAELIAAPGWRWSWWCMVPHGAGVHFGRTDVAWGLEVSMGVGMSPAPSWGCDWLRLVATDLDLGDLKGCFFVGFFL